ncbi:thiol-disulfide isomerase/thioredoxin [Aquabacterium commune]|uniref:Thiol-disulfide isomerase/thioredoxin n=1 Tax=Aquabacterium commune TaxID=70586 RepID=A0A4R6R121_9BURK|nr:TlpA disulfide reductase family protein [Aquabacterium commune]TDP79352.1 thiol-disulfide isomerase/thioredoxin [Aquabacterium commune]
MSPTRPPASPRPAATSTSAPTASAQRQHGEARRAALIALALGATAAGAWFGLRRQGSPAAPTDASNNAATAGTAASAPTDAASAPLIAGDVLQAGFWAQQFDTPAGGSLTLAHLKGKPVLLNFWATWCPPCVKEMPELDRFQSEFASKGWQVLGLAIDGPTPVKEFLAKVPVGFGIGLAGFGGTELAQALGNAAGGLPFSLLIDAQGRVRHRKMGATDFDELAGWAREITP